MERPREREGLRSAAAGVEDMVGGDVYGREVMAMGRDSPHLMTSTLVARRSSLAQ
jgi:hypothetical protein